MSFIGTRRTITGIALIKTLKVLVMVPIVSCAAVRGATAPGVAAPPFATGSCPRSGATARAFGWFVLLLPGLRKLLGSRLRSLPEASPPFFVRPARRFASRRCSCWYPEGSACHDNAQVKEGAVGASPCSGRTNAGSEMRMLSKKPGQARPPNDRPHRDWINRVVSGNSDNTGAIGHDDVFALPLNPEPGLLQSPNCNQMIDAGEPWHD